MAKPVKHYGNWRIRWIDENGRRRSEVYPRRDDAVFKLREHEHRVAEIRRQLRLPDPIPTTFDEVADHWLKHRGALKRSLACDRSIIRTHLLPAFGGLMVSEVTQQRIEELALSKAHLHKNTVHHILTLLSTLLRMAVGKNWLRQIPEIKKPPLRLFNVDFHYLRTADEIRRVLHAARDHSPFQLALIATAVYTGMRQGELAGLRWHEVDFENRLILVAHSWDGPPKNGDARHVPIVDALLPTLREWRLATPGAFVFANRDGGMFAKSARVFQEQFRDVLDAAGLPRVERHGRLRRYIRFHDLRHTFASHWMLNGGDIFKLQAILGHKSPQMTMRYAHLAPAAFAADHARLGSPLQFDGAVVLPLNDAR